MDNATLKNITLSEHDMDLLAILTADFNEAKGKAQIYGEQAQMAMGHRQAFIRTLIRKAGVPADVQYGLSPDGRLLVPIQPPAPAGEKG